VIVAIAALPFLPTLRAGFLADDWFFVATYHNMQASLAHFVWRALFTLEDIPTTFYRPVPFITLATEIRLAGLDSVGLHATNLLLHGIAAALVFTLARRLTGGATHAAVIATLAVAWFPRRTEAVAWLSCRPDLVSAVFSLASLAAFHVALRARQRSDSVVSPPAPPALPALLLSLFFWWLALLSKESALLVPAAHAVLAWEVLRKESAPTRSRTREIITLLAPFAVSAPCYLVLRRLAIGAWVGGYGAGVLAISPATLLSGAKHLAYQVIPPVEPLEFIVRAAWPRPVVAVLLLLLLGLFARPLWLARRDVALRVGVAWIVANMLPVVTLPISIATSLNDRLLYLPGFGVALIAAALLRRVSSRTLVPAAAVGGCVLGIWSWTLSDRWAQANVLSTRILTSLADGVRNEDASRIYLAAVPDSLGGAYVLRNGVNHALSVMGIPDPMRVVPLTFYFADLDDPFRNPVGASLDAPGTLRLESTTGGPQLMLPLVDPERVAHYQVDGLPDRFSRFQSMRVHLYERGLVLTLSAGGFREVDGY
jgi:hypothetical protein